MGPSATLEWSTCVTPAKGFLMRSTLILPKLLVAAAVVATATGCGTTSFGDESYGEGTQMSADEVAALVAQVRGSGKPAYYLGPTVDELHLAALDLVEENAPAFQVEADYGSCQSTGDGGCSAPVVVSTNDRRDEVEGTTCRRLERQLGVPAGVLMGELTLVTGDLVVTVSDFRGRGGSDDVEPALRLLPKLRAVGTSRPLGTLPQPSTAGTRWLDEVCGTMPGAEVSHSMEGPADPSANAMVPDFTVERLGGGELRWADYAGKPVVIAVGTVAQVSATVRELQPLVAKAPSHPTLLGLVDDPTGDKFNPRPVSDIEQEAGHLPATVGYAAVPLSAVWFLDAASNTGTQMAWEEGIVAFVDGSGSVVRFASASTPPAQLSELARGLG